MEMLKRRAYTTKTWTKGMEHKFNRLDKEATKIMLACEKSAYLQPLESTHGAQN